MSTPVLPFREILERKRVAVDRETSTAPSPREALSFEETGFHAVRTMGTGALAPIPIDTLYPATENNRHDLIRALQLLPQAIRALEGARDTIRSGDLLQSDQHVHAVQVLLPELFRCRTIGDGFAATINALEIALVNQHGEPLTEKEIGSSLRALKELRSHPFLSFDNAQQLIEELEKTGLLVDPASLGDLLDAGT
jgi:hypothetical protein